MQGNMCGYMRKPHRKRGLKMITMVAAQKVFRDKPGDWYLAVMTSTSMVDGVVTGKDVVGASDDDRFAAGSAIITPGGNVIAFEDETFSTKS